MFWDRKALALRSTSGFGREYLAFWRVRPQIESQPLFRHSCHDTLTAVERNRAPRDHWADPRVQIRMLKMVGIEAGVRCPAKREKLSPHSTLQI